ncbi:MULTISPECIES: DUF4148 domain-containing protein [Paraburkholderia]|uniref:DUF4148 domain-containing protein n=1 Tax=Paraburkholderia TaxID=1822464 RepID=UPI0006D3CD2A|nr:MULTISPECIES: DUF4148 domain-containing protein [Paraburkholderia]ALP66085.1 hypothetical protein AN416_26765 [Paraburkholderia caribensis]AUT54982.1 DUF4148 domain-containing protein [Paraburkholderia caribensis]CAG9213656.1 conserved exported hypothetical protein [Paraburkholderia caribensis]
MHKFTLTAAALGLILSASAFAQSTPSTPGTSGAAASPAPQVAQSSVPAMAGQWVPPYGEAVQPKTRAQVYQELIQAEKDGQLAYLNSTVYAH